MAHRDLDPILKAAIADYRKQLRKPLKEPGRTGTYFMFPTTRVDANFNVFNDGPRIGFNAETLARLLVLFPQRDAAERALQEADLKGLGRLIPVAIFTDERVFDEASQRSYTARLQIEFARGITIPMRDPATGSEMQRNGGVTAHEMLRASIENWRDVEQITIERSIAVGNSPALTE